VASALEISVLLRAVRASARTRIVGRRGDGASRRRTIGTRVSPRSVVRASKWTTIGIRWDRGGSQSVSSSASDLRRRRRKREKDRERERERKVVVLSRGQLSKLGKLLLRRGNGGAVTPVTRASLFPVIAGIGSFDEDSGSASAECSRVRGSAQSPSRVARIPSVSSRARNRATPSSSSLVATRKSERNEREKENERERERERERGYGIRRNEASSPAPYRVSWH